ncbi:MAG: hypothetical protein GW754_01505 [Candidatus Pacebacteria bacterium]|nr:hypothetical protein [Candidatus Pacearchaeota archaeon]NCQ65496.1 hypothetical protein [Candidatus Paceibacterota bacterium]NCS86889.1 hypothetical protein [Candidatus Paceibacterota bacterium]
MLEIPYWINVHKVLVKYKKIIFKLFTFSYFLGGSIIAFGFYLFNNYPLIYLIIQSLAKSFGTLALFMFLATLTPGILSRFKIFPLFASSIVLFRRQLGILMFITAMVHSFYLITIPGIMTSQFGPDFLTIRDLLGSLSLIILLPAWLTSNNYSQKKFGKIWKIIQRVTYISLVMIFIHVAFTSLKLGVLTFGVFLLEFSSWLKVWFFDKK